MTNDIERVQEIFGVSEEVARKLLTESVDINRSDESTEEMEVIDGVDLNEHMDDLIDGEFVDENTGKYWRIHVDDEYIETWEEGDEVVAKDNRHELSCYGASEQEAIETLQEALKEFLVLKTVRQNGATGIVEIENELNMGMRDLANPLGSLLDRGEIYEPQPDQLKIVPDCD
ncbi:hypothetical protein [Halomicrobium sp. LC1Hm]|uniref:hypothetical protein n=1 Tax=Halomicrobium sp. LC1Hm TaxID=2610902 RepID=UPI0012985637|nr:hypothetical protein [Halomicrobium sp. LC1Hm]QGA82106.1 hypothetical protein LC1Hm_1046 [Halomicrobium sp. LC1Hm]